MDTYGLFLLGRLENFECKHSTIECRVCLIWMATGVVSFVVPPEAFRVLIGDQRNELVGDFGQVPAIFRSVNVCCAHMVCSLPHESDSITLDGRHAVVIPSRGLRPVDDGRLAAPFLGDVLRYDDIQSRLQGFFRVQQ